MGEAIAAVTTPSSGILLGRATYEMFEPAWSTRTVEDDPGAPFFNDTTKYVVSSTLERRRGELGDHRAVRPAALQRLKDEVDGDLYVSGSGTLVGDARGRAGRRPAPVRLSAHARCRPSALSADAAPSSLSLRTSDSYENGVIYWPTHRLRSRGAHALSPPPREVQLGGPGACRTTSGRWRRAAAATGNGSPSTCAGRRSSPSSVLCSSAARTRQTLELLRPALGGATVLVENELYGASSDQLLARIRLVPDEVACVLVIGHNPVSTSSRSALASAGDGLERLEEKFPTAALATLAPAEPWGRVAPGWRDPDRVRRAEAAR
jgi:phosphohistidine phosphatase SixA